MSIEKKLEELIENSEELKQVEEVSEELRIDVSEDVAALVNGEQLSEEFKAKAATIFEAAVVSRVKAEVAALKEEFDLQLENLVEERTEEIREGLIEKVDGYLNYVVEQWMTDNALALENGVKNEIFESFIHGMKNVFENHYVEMPEEKYNVLEEMQAEIEFVKSKLNESVKEGIELRKMLDESSKVKAIQDFTDGMTEVDSEKFIDLAEELIFENEESFKKKLQTIKENYFMKKPSTTAVSSVVTDEPVQLKEEAPVNKTMSIYLKAINGGK
jgi:hypothetical protein